MDKNEEWLLNVIEEERDKLLPILGECNAGKLEIRVFILESFLEAMKGDPSFNQGIYHALKKLVGWKMYSATAHKGEDGEEVKRQLEVAVMMDKMFREGQK